MRSVKPTECRAHGQVTCSCGDVISRCKCVGPVPFTSIECIHRMTVRELFQQLVDRAVAHKEENPTRMVFGLKRIADHERRSVDDVFRELKGTVKLRTGSDRLPGESLRT